MQHANGTWSSVDLPPSKKAIGCRWIFNIKRNCDGSIERFKSRLVAKGCSQQQGVNYDETFSPVVRYATIRMVIALAAEHKMYLHQMDVSTAYLNSELADEVYMKQPQCFEDKDFPGKVLKLNKAIYGLKQSGRAWNTKLDEVLRKIGFTPCESEPCLYKMNQEGNFNLIAVYVDDLILASTNKAELIQIKAQIASSFDLVDKGPLQHFLGMQIVLRRRNWCDICWSKTICPRSFETVQYGKLSSCCNTTRCWLPGQVRQRKL